MNISLVSNLINIIGNYIGVFVVHAGVAGVAVPSLIARAFSAIVITCLCFNAQLAAYYTKEGILTWDSAMLKRVLNIAVPNGIENGIFQFVKVALSSVVALFGTYQIAANGIAQSIWSLAALMGVALGPVYITVIGQCMGKQDTSQAKYYFKKLNRLALVLSLIWNVLIFLITPGWMKFYQVSQETKQMVIYLVAIHNFFNAFVYPFSGPLSNGLRAAGDVKFTMIVSVVSTVLARFVFSLLFAIYFNLGVIGIALAMCLDWSLRAVIFYLRYKSGKWMNFKVI